MIFAELAGGLALILGLWPRGVALVLFIEMLGIIAFHLPQGWVFPATGGGREDPARWAVGLLALALLGDGAAAMSAQQGRSRRGG